MAAQRQRSQLAALISPPSRGGRRAQASGGGGGGGGAGGGGYVSDPGPVSPVLSPKSYKTLRQELMEERKRQHESVERERQALNAMLREHTDNMRRARASLEEERMQLHRTLTQRKFEEEDMKDIELDQLRLQQTAGEATLLLAMQGRLLLARRQPFQPPPPKQQSTPPRSSIDGNNNSTSFLPDIHNNTTTSRRRSSNHHHVRVPADEAWLHAMRASSESNISSTSTNTSTSTSSNMDYRTHARSKRNKLEDPVRAAAQAGMLSVEVERMARLLGMDPQVDREFLGIAEAALRAPLPNGWMRHVNSGRDVYVHDVTGKVLYEHPMLEQFRRRFRAAKKARKDIEKLRCEQEAQRQMLR
eukprot:jgi/Chlat1/1207/Chrsp115S00743